MKNFIKFYGSGLKNGKIATTIYRVDRERLDDIFCDFEEGLDFEDLLREVDAAIFFEEHEAFEGEVYYLEALKKFRAEVKDYKIPSFIEVYHNN